MNIQRLINDLISAGVTQVEIAKAMEVEQPTVSRYRSGDIKTCSYMRGKALIDLHRRRVPERRSRRTRSEARAA